MRKIYPVNMRCIKSRKHQKPTSFLNNFDKYCSFALVAFPLLFGYIKIYQYAYYCGYFDYWSINRYYIDIGEDFSSLFFTAACCIVALSPNIFTYTIIMSDSPIKTKVIIIIAVALIALSIFPFCFVYLPILPNCRLHPSDKWIAVKFFFSSPFFMLSFFVLSFISYGIGISSAILNGDEDNVQNNKTEKKRKTSVQRSVRRNTKTILKSISGILFLSLLCIPLTYFLSCNLHETMRNSRVYRIINNEFVVLYETNTHFLVADCKIDDITNTLTIDNKKNINRTLISKDGITTTSHLFDSVESATWERMK
ncbi:MAG: hypothetical protein IKI88_00165 [Anaerotignum sp.]|nr:hypothetical protein [Anaerotignum sp.]